MHFNAYRLNFAWFTDTATTGVNTIVSGNPDIDLVDNQGISLENEPVGFVDDKGNAFTTQILREPGARYILHPITLVNNGNLWAKCKLVITAANGIVNADKTISESTETHADPASVITEKHIRKTE